MSKFTFLFILVLTFMLGFFSRELWQVYQHPIQADAEPVETVQSPLVIDKTLDSQTLSSAASTPSISNESPTDPQVSSHGGAQSWRLLAEAYEKQGRDRDAIEAWFSYIEQETDARKKGAALLHLNQYLLRVAELLSQNPTQYAWLIEKLNAGIRIMPDVGDLHLLLATLYLKAGDRESAQYHALIAVNYPELQAGAETVLASLSEDILPKNFRSDEKNIPLIRYGNQFLVQVSLDGHTAKLLLDTGASISGVTTEYINAHSSLVKTTKPIKLNTASGSVDSYIFIVDRFLLDDMRFEKHMLAHLPVQNLKDFDGLLGVDVLGRFEFVIDQDNAALILRKRKSK
jgi:predicted aspartyl protease